MSDEDIMEVYVPTDNSFIFEIDDNLYVKNAAFPLWNMSVEKTDYF